MALVKQKLSVPLAQGINTKIDPKQAQIGVLEVLDNAVFDEPGTLKKRKGYDKLDVTLLDGSIITTPQKLTTYKDELCVFNKTNLYSYSESTAKWTDKGTVSNIFPTSTSVVRNTHQQYNVDSAHVGELNIYSWQDSRGGVRISVIDNVTGNELISDLEITATGIFSRIAYINNIVYFFYVDGINLKYRTLKVSNPNNITAEISVVAGDINATNKVYDVASFSDRIYVGYNSTAATLKVFYINENGILSSVSEDAAESPSIALDLAPDMLFRPMITYYNGTAVKFMLKNAGLTTNLISPTVIETIADVINVTSSTKDSITFEVLYEITAASTSDNFIRMNTITTSAVVGTAADFLRSVGLGSKPILFEGIYYLSVIHESYLQSSTFIVNENAEVVSKISPSLSGGTLVYKNLPKISQISDTVFLYASQIKGRTVSEDNTLFSLLGVNSTKLEFNLDVKYDNAILGENLHVAGGMIQSYDGKEIVEHGFHIFPEDLIAGATTTTGGFMSDGEYQYTAIYSWTDNKGQEHKSAPAIPIIVTLGGGTTTQTQAITIPTLRITEKSSVVIDLYRTEGTGTVFYKETSVSNPVYNDKTIDSVTIISSLSDIDLISNEVLYTTGGDLENIAPPAASIIESFQNRVFLAGLEDGNKIQYSKLRFEGRPVEFNDTFYININPIGGKIKSLAAMDDKLIIFKETAIYFLAGSGPNNAGEQDAFTEPELISNDVGCKTQNSVVLTPTGLMFQSFKGIYLLEKALGTSYIGSAIESLNALTVKSASFLPTKNQVIFVTDGKALVFNYFVNQWSTYTNHQGISSTILKQKLYYVRENNEVYIESDEYTDNGSFIQLNLETGWMSFAGVQGYQRVYKMLILGNYKSPHKLTSRIAYNFIEAYIQEKTVDSDNFTTPTTYGSVSPYGAESVYGGSGNQYQMRIDFKKQKCESVKLQIRDSQDSDYSEGVQISNILIVVGTKNSEFKPAQARIYGTN